MPKCEHMTDESRMYTLRRLIWGYDMPHLVYRVMKGCSAYILFLFCTCTSCILVIMLHHLVIHYLSLLPDCVNGVIFGN